MLEQKNSGDHSDDGDELSASDESEPEEQPSSAAFVQELEEEEEEEEEDAVEVEVCAPAFGHRALNTFSLRGGNSAFTNRSHSIFESLDSVAGLASSSLKQDNVTDEVFARPLPPRPSRKTSQPLSICPTPAKKKGPPDYLVHPERWTHYNLEDVTETSDQGNSRVAHEFLSSLHQRKEEQENCGDSSCDSQQKIIFSRDSGHQKERVADHLSPVGDKKKETRLCHLEEEEEEQQCVEKLKAGGKTVNQSVEEEDKNEDDDKPAAVSRPEEKKEKNEGEVKIEEVNSSFTSFRKSKLKNYRKSSGQEDN